MVWAIENPRAGIVEADEIDHARVLEIARPYLGELVGVYTDWTPLQDRERAVPGGARSRRPVAVQELPRRLRKPSARAALSAA